MRRVTRAAQASTRLAGRVPRRKNDLGSRRLEPIHEQESKRAVPPASSKTEPALRRCWCAPVACAYRVPFQTPRQSVSATKDTVNRVSKNGDRTKDHDSVDAGGVAREQNRRRFRRTAHTRCAVCLGRA